MIRDRRTRTRSPRRARPTRGARSMRHALAGERSRSTIALRRVAAALLLALLAGLPGCTYFRHLGKDAGETLHLSVGASLIPGLHARVQAPLFGTSVGWLRRGAYVGTDYGHAHVWKQAAAGVVLGGSLVRTDLDADIDRYWTGRLADTYLDTSHYFVVTLVATDKRTSLGRRTLALTKFEAGAHVLFFGVQLGVDVLEVLDLLTGVAGWDLLGDDDYDPTVEIPDDPPPPRVKDRERKPARAPEHEELVPGASSSVDDSETDRP